ANLAGIEDVLQCGCAVAEREIVQQIAETATPVCETGDDLLRHMVARRAALAEGAREAGLAIVAAGTHPSTPPEDLVRTEGTRYAQQEVSFPWVWRESNTCGMHVHVGMRDAETAVATCDALRPYLPMLLALSANSPMWRGEPTGLASIRALLIRMHPRSGMPPVLGTFQRYVDMVRGLTQAGPGDGSWLWWFARPHATHGTLEVRVCDPQSDVRNAHALACFIRALCLRLADGQLPTARREDPADLLLEDTLWNAIRSGPRGRSVIDQDPTRTLGEQATDLIDELEADLTSDVARRLRLLAQAPEGDLQVQTLDERGSMTEVTLALAERTVAAPRFVRSEDLASAHS
ncbi:MAG: glutamate--cysteine ligase, partial [Thermoleophilia bacterium]|nr:glutamate--cysteine ligase [Thermoleophilia bacterium]